MDALAPTVGIGLDPLCAHLADAKRRLRKIPTNGHQLTHIATAISNRSELALAGHVIEPGTVIGHGLSLSMVVVVLLVVVVLVVVVMFVVVVVVVVVMLMLMVVMVMLMVPWWRWW